MAVSLASSVLSLHSFFSHQDILWCNHRTFVWLRIKTNRETSPTVSFLYTQKAVSIAVTHKPIAITVGKTLSSFPGLGQMWVVSSRCIGVGVYVLILFMCKCAYVRVHVCLHIPMYLSMCTCRRVCVYVLIIHGICLYIYICITCVLCVFLCVLVVCSHVGSRDLHRSTFQALKWLQSS